AAGTTPTGRTCVSAGSMSVTSRQSKQDKVPTKTNRLRDPYSRPIRILSIAGVGRARQTLKRRSAMPVEASNRATANGIRAVRTTDTTSDGDTDAYQIQGGTSRPALTGCCRFIPRRRPRRRPLEDHRRRDGPAQVDRRDQPERE